MVSKMSTLIDLIMESIIKVGRFFISLDWVKKIASVDSKDKFLNK